MNQERKQLLLTALRSGEYPQASGTLNDGTGFCCLGVACEIYRKETGQGEWILSKLRDRSVLAFLPKKDDLEDKTILPTVVMEWFGFKQQNPYCEQGSLANMNDRGASFGDIAHVLETEDAFKETEDETPS